MIEATDIIPQRHPFVMIDALESFEDKIVETVFTVREDNIFVREGYLSESGLMENIAQSCAARTGYISKYILHKPVDIGYIGQIKGLKILSRPKVGQTLKTRITVVGEIFGITSVSAEVICEGEVIAKGSMKLATKKEDESNG